MPATVILLAAGCSRRFGGDKRLALLPSGKPVLFATLANIQASGLPLKVILAPNDQALAERLQALNIDTAICPDAELGMGHSLAFGVASTTSNNGWLIALADMPAIRPDTYLRIAQALESHALVIPELADGRRGHPVGFAACFKQQLLQCQGDQGARHIVQQQPAHLVTLDDAGIIADIDRPEDLRQWC
ncbi:hypothetical protein GCM10011297_19880 [Bacterioplanes sanyensis]|uniref:nucleotidyltransferase family protein n=1 Tax=Bacterioplanes sanyensis TaxID=1249553 RepID=UPI0016748586|nr:nucleotidyltransferase family protein [Bacterioplanes sanyensis]GGY46963.1 hypothetical protein GCM10011297_19880 [Bacterioplanes sanyensis]